ncbi:hypothetical protein IGI96_003633 [Enterococcus sp. DIV0421]|uniref:SpaA isopeptide-forming pilin-related protein n=1 Tax=Enterococcus sp. DIV0421 TaxID=2774688 RepID=UPI003F242F1B
MNQKRKYSIFLILLAMIIPLFANFVPQKHVYAEETLDINQFYGTSMETTAKIQNDQGQEYKLMDPLYIQYPNQTEQLRVAYCIEKTKAFPLINEQINYEGNRYDVEQDPTEEFNKVGAQSLDTPRDNYVTATQGIRNALYRGYPIDADNLQDTYQLSDHEFWHITQMAIHYWSDTEYNQHNDPFTAHSPYEYGIYNDLRKAKGLPSLSEPYNHLIGKGTGNMSTAPNDMQLLLFIPQDGARNQQGHEYQRMISADFKEREIQFKKVDEDGKAIPNVEFTIQRQPDFLTTLPQLFNKSYFDEYRFTTGDNGTIKTVVKGNKYDEDGNSLGVIFGNYVLTEVNTPSGYQGLTGPITFTVIQNRTGQPEIKIDDQTHPDRNKIKFETNYDQQGNYQRTTKGFTIQVTNEKKGFEFKFKKTDAKSAPLGDATFDILRKDDQTQVTSFTSDEKGAYQSVILPEGSYILKESKTPDTYQTMPELEFSVSNQGVLTFTDQELSKKYVTTQSGPEKKYDIKNIPKIDEPQATIKTQVEVNGKKSEQGKPVTVKTDGKDTVISFTDHLTYEGLVAGEEYTITAYLYEKHPDGLVVDNSNNFNEIGKKLIPITIRAEEGRNTIDVNFPRVTVKPGVKYVVMAKIRSNSDIEFVDGTRIHTINHDNPDDNLQTFYGAVKNPGSSISTVVEVDGKKSTETQPLQLDITSDKTRVNVTDHLTYENLIAGKTYVATAYLWEIKEDDSKVDPTKNIPLNRFVSQEFIAKESGGMEDLVFQNLELSAGSTYVVTQTLTSKEDIPLEAGFGPHKVEHNLNLQDKAQTFTIKQVPKQTLTVEKKVTGFSGDKTKEFTFNLTVNPDQYLKDGDKLTATLHKKYGETTTKTNQEITVGTKYQFKLKDGEYLDVQGLYENSTYTLNEAEFGQEGYKTTVTVNDKLKDNAQTNTTYMIVKGDNKVVFTNHNGKIVPTGILLNSAPYLAGAAFVALLGIILRLSRRRKKLK